MNGHRTCVVCLPRSGSQLCEKLVSEIHNAFSLDEYLEKWHESHYKLDENKNISLIRHIHITSPFIMREDVAKRIDFLKQINKDQPLTLRLFLMDNYDKAILKNIMTELKGIGFEFIALYRDAIMDQLLSFMLAYSWTGLKKEMVFHLNTVIDKPIHINLTPALRERLSVIKTSSVHWDRNVSVVLDNIPFERVSYETMYADMEKIYQRKFNYSGNKTITVDPMDLILNKEEVMDFLNNQ